MGRLIDNPIVIVAIILGAILALFLTFWFVVLARKRKTPEYQEKLREKQKQREQKMQNKKTNLNTPDQSQVLDSTEEYTESIIVVKKKKSQKSDILDLMDKHKN